jgi:D-arabinose 1-dehydrogenase-like Zn-dependent alcohol dehydrogenase
MPNAPKTCRAALLKAYREPLAVEEVQVPQEIEPGALLVKNDASSICGSDMHVGKPAPREHGNRRGSAGRAGP